LTQLIYICIIKSINKSSSDEGAAEGLTEMIGAAREESEIDRQGLESSDQGLEIGDVRWRPGERESEESISMVTAMIHTRTNPEPLKLSKVMPDPDRRDWSPVWRSETRLEAITPAGIVRHCPSPLRSYPEPPMEEPS
jgi:hypothetical protein